MSFEVYLYFWYIWLIIGMVFIMLEFIDGSTLFFLPLGIGGVLMAVFLGGVESGLVSIGVLPGQWIYLVLVWAVLSFLAALMLIWRRRISRKDDPEDINSY